MKKNVVAQKGGAVLALSLLLVVPACKPLDWLKEKVGWGSVSEGSDSSTGSTSADSSWLAKMDGKPLVTEERLKVEKKDLMESNPQLKAMAAFLEGKQFDRNLTEGLTNQAVVDRYVADNGLDKTPEYKDEMRRMDKSIKQMLNTKYFSQAFPVEVADADAKAFYDKNKDELPTLMVSRGGVKASGVQFDKEADAKAFLAKAKDASDLQKVATSNGMKDKVRDFNVVNNESLAMDAKVRDAVVSMTKLPNTQMVKVNDKTFWVVQGTSKEEAKYRPFEQVAGELKQHLEKEKRIEMFEKEIANLRKQYNVVVNDDYFKEAAPVGMANDETSEADMTSAPTQHADAAVAQDSATAQTV